MEQEKAAGKVLLEWIDNGIIKEDDQEIVFMGLQQVYAVGFDTGTKARSHKKQTAQFSLEGKLINIFESAAEAARRTKIQHSDIARCASGKVRKNGGETHTAGGYKWKYVNKKPKNGKISNSSESE